MHFKLDTDNKKGSFLANIHSVWLKNIGDQKVLKEMEKEHKELIIEIEGLITLCSHGYENVIKMIIDLKTSAK